MSELEVEGLVWTAGGGKPFLVPACLVFPGTGDQPSLPGHVAVVPREPDTAGNIGNGLQSEATIDGGSIGRRRVN